MPQLSAHMLRPWLSIEMYFAPPSPAVATMSHPGRGPHPYRLLAGIGLNND